MTKNPTPDASGQDEPKHIATFEVGECGTLRLAGYEDPQTRREIYDVPSSWGRSAQSLLSACEDCEPLASEVRGIYYDVRSELAEEIVSLDRELRQAAERAAAGTEQLAPREQALAAKRTQLAAMPEEPWEGAPPWLAAMDKARFKDLVVPQIKAWLDEAPDQSGDEADYLPDHATGEGLAFSFFDESGSGELLGVGIIDGPHPGSSYRAAVLETSVAEANAAAEAEKLPVRFVAAPSKVDRALEKAYRETDYRVLGPVPFTLRVGTVSPALAALHREHGVAASAFVTACNPLSQSLTDAQNAARHEALRAELQRRRLRHVEGSGQHPSNGWPPEASFLVLGLDLRAARALGNRWQQNAIVWSGAHAVPDLIFLR